MKKVKVLVTATTFPRWQGDTEPPFVYHLSEYLSKKGFEMIILAPHHPGAKHVEKMGNLKVYRFPYFYPKKYQRLCYEGGALPNMEKSFLAKIQVPFLVLSELYYMVKVIRREKINLIHAHWILPNGLLGVLCKRLFRVPLIITAHGSDVFALKSKFFRMFKKFALDRSDACIANSSATRSAILDVSRDADVIVIPMGVDSNLFNSQRRNTELKKKYNISGPFLLTVGRLTHQKGIQFLLEAFSGILSKFPNSKLIIIGDGKSVV